MKQLTIRLAWVFFTFCATCMVQAQETVVDDGIPCGMVASADGMKIESRNFEICPEDVGFQGSYFLFADFFKDPALYGIVSLFVSDETLNSPFTEFADGTINASGSVYFILSITSYIAWILLAGILPYKSYRYFSLIQKTGKADFTDSKNDLVKFVSYTGFLIFLILPAGTTGGRNGDLPPVMLAQSLSVIGSLPANMAGNYFYSTFLSTTELAASEVKLKEELLLPTGQNIANGFIEGQLCQMRTRQALLSINGKSGSEFFTTRGIGEVVLGIDQEDVIKRYDKCLGYVGTGEEGETESTINMFSIDKVSNRVPLCNSTDKLVYDAELYGQNHSCMRVTYGTGDGKFQALFKEDQEGEDGDSDSMESVIENIHDSYKASKWFRIFKAMAKSKTRAILRDDDLDSDEKYAQLNDYFISMAQSNIGVKIQEDAYLTEGTNDQKTLKYMAVSSALLGGTIDMGDVAQVWENGLSGVSSHHIDYSGLDKVGDHVFGVDTFVEEGKEIALLIQRYQCAINWNKHKSTRLFIAKFNSASDQDQIESLFSGDDAKMECVEFLSDDERGDTDFDKYIRYPTLDNDTYADIEKSAEGIWLPRIMSTESELTIYKRMTDEIAKEYFDEIRTRQMILAGYSAAVKKAVADNLSDDLSNREAEDDFDAQLRPRGWAVFGGAMLFGGQNQSSSAHMAKSIDNTIKIESGGSDLRFVDRDAFGENRNDNVNDIIDELFTPMAVDTLLTIGESGAANYPGPQGVTPDDKDAAMLTQFMRMLESMFFGSFSHIKAASGMDEDATLAEGFRSCFDGGYDQCLSGNKHPIIALSNFGNEIMNDMLMVMTVDAALRAVNRIAGMGGADETGQVTNNRDKQKKSYKNFADKAGDFLKNIGGKLMKVVGGVVGVVLKVLGSISLVATVIMDTIYPLVIILFIGGATFAYIIPMMSFLYGFMMFLLSMVAIFTMAVVIPIYIVTKFLHIETEYKNGFQNFYQDFLGNFLTPAFFVISGVISWNIIFVILFVLNVTFTLVYQGLGITGGTGLSSFFFQVFMYVTYLISVFVLFRFGLGIMKSLPDQMKEKLKLKKGNDEQYIDSLGFEQYVNAQVMQQIAVLPTNLAKGLANYNDAGGFKSKKELRDAADRAEDFADLIDSHGGAQEFAQKLHAIDEMTQANRDAYDLPDAMEKRPGHMNVGNENQGDKAPDNDSTHYSAQKDTQASSTSDESPGRPKSDHENSKLNTDHEDETPPNDKK